MGAYPDRSAEGGQPLRHTPNPLVINNMHYPFRTLYVLPLARARSFNKAWRPMVGGLAPCPLIHYWRPSIGGLTLGFQ